MFDDPAYFVILFYPHIQMLYFTAVHSVLVNYVDEPTQTSKHGPLPKEAHLIFPLPAYSWLTSTEACCLNENLRHSCIIVCKSSRQVLLWSHMRYDAQRCNHQKKEACQQSCAHWLNGVLQIAALCTFPQLSGLL